MTILSPIFSEKRQHDFIHRVTSIEAQSERIFIFPEVLTKVLQIISSLQRICKRNQWRKSLVLILLRMFYLKPGCGDW